VKAKTSQHRSDERKAYEKKRKRSLGSSAGRNICEKLKAEESGNQTGGEIEACIAKMKTEESVSSRRKAYQAGVAKAKTVENAAAALEMRSGIGSEAANGESGRNQRKSRKRKPTVSKPRKQESVAS